MLTRQKILLALISDANQRPSRMRLFKYAFLLKEEGHFPAQFAFYDFLPYRYGPYSFALERELATLCNCSYISTDDKHVWLRPEMTREIRNVVDGLGSNIQYAIRSVRSRYDATSNTSLLRKIYSRYPAYAVNSVLTNLIPGKLKKPELAKPNIYTIGYEGSSVDKLLFRVFESGMQTIVDVRANPISRKYGFAKSSLRRLAEKIGINYLHVPELGIPSAKRKGLATLVDFESLFVDYETAILPAQSKVLDRIAEYVLSNRSVLLCRELDADSCHRSRLAMALKARTGLSICHLSA